MQLSFQRASEYVNAGNLTLFKGSDAIHLKLDNVYSLSYKLSKRFIDILFALIFIIIFFPFWLVVAVIVKAASPGPVFYRAGVKGLHRKTFTMYKFRTMYHNCSTNRHRKLVEDMIKNNRTTEKLKSDNRITPVGRFLRKYSIDEFPQLLNVLKGDMGLVGPRPCLPYEYEIMSDWHKQRFMVKPGITGLWQVTGRNRIRFNEQIVLDLLYIENRSLLLDLKIMLHTIPVVLLGQGGA